MMICRSGRLCRDVTYCDVHVLVFDELTSAAHCETVLNVHVYFMVMLFENSLGV